MFVVNMVPTDYITFDNENAILVLDSIVNDGYSRFLNLKLIQGDNVQDIKLSKDFAAEITISGKTFPLEARKIQPSCGRVYFSDDFNSIKLKYHKGTRCKCI